VSELYEETSGSAHNNFNTLRCFQNKFTLSVPFPMQFYFKHCSKYVNVLHVKTVGIGNTKRLCERDALKKSVIVGRFSFSRDPHITSQRGVIYNKHSASYSL